MKRSKTMRTRLSALSLPAFGLAAGLICAAWQPAAAEESTYQPWSGSQAQGQQTTQQQLQKLVTDLKTLIKKAEDAKAADPNFLTDLKKLAAQYDTGAIAALGGPGTVFLFDDFKDGEYNANPAWKVSAGTWKVDSKGSNTGLVSKFGQASNKVTGNDVLKAILGVQEQEQPQSTYASIYTVAKMTNAFKMTMKFTSGTTGGPLNIGPYQGASASSAYRLVYQPGNETAFILQRVVGNQVVQIGAYEDPINLEDGKPHTLIWQRESTGKMRVYLDGQQIMIAKDTQITGNLDGWLNINQGGSYWIREIKVEGI